MKKLFLVAAMTVMLGSLGTVFAADKTFNNTTNAGEVELTYTLGQSYTITIPDAINFTAQGTDLTQSISASDVLINAGSKLKVVITGANCSGDQWFLKDGTDASNKAEYTVKNGGTALKNGDTVLEVVAGTATGNANLVFNLNSGITKAGTYKDMLTFTSSIVANVSVPDLEDPF